MTEAVLGKEYASLKGYHSGELVNWVVSDVTVIKNGVMSLLPPLLRTAMRFIGTAATLISWD